MGQLVIRSLRKRARRMAAALRNGGVVAATLGVCPRDQMQFGIESANHGLLDLPLVVAAVPRVWRRQPFDEFDSRRERCWIRSFRQET